MCQAQLELTISGSVLFQLKYIAISFFAGPQ